MKSAFTTSCAEKRDEAHRLSIVRMARASGGSEASQNEALELSTLDHRVRQTIADQRPNHNRTHA